MALSVPQELHDCYDSTCYTALENYWGWHSVWEQPVFHSSLDHDSRWQGFLLTHLAFYMLNT